ncbi:hypothetical protein VNO78_20996 [Psophocarpus tetragonolobus]|uniref:Uncharacterized protein n=1 Tax=Psophocarpus tetragonolobus TaxID=3891 RepID=A0AAN9SED7_PSOTE
MEFGKMDRKKPRLRSRDRSNAADDSGKTREHVSNYCKLSFLEHLFMVETDAMNNSSVTQQRNNDGLKKSFVPSVIIDNAKDPPETYIACCSKTPLQDTPFTLDTANKEESRQVASMRRQHRPKDINEDKPKRIQKPITLKLVQTQENPPVKRKHLIKGLNKTSNPPTEVLPERKYKRRKQVNKTSDPPTFDEFVFLKKLAERSQSSSFDCGSLNRIRNSDTEPNCTAKKKTSASLTKKKRSRKKKFFPVQHIVVQISNSKYFFKKKKLCGKRNYVRKKRLNLTPIPPTKMTELTEANLNLTISHGEGVKKGHHLAHRNKHFDVNGSCRPNLEPFPFEQCNCRRECI